MFYQVDTVVGAESSALRRSLLGLVYTYNCLPQAVVDLEGVSCFQRRLQNAVKTAARLDIQSWPSIFVDGCHSMTFTQFHRLFDA